MIGGATNVALLSATAEASAVGDAVSMPVNGGADTDGT